MNIDDDCTVVTDMPLGDEVADFIMQGNTDVDELAKIYEKYHGTYLSYGLAEMTLFFAETVFERDDAHEMISNFVDFNN